jgi:hypothetical protein
MLKAPCTKGLRGKKKLLSVVQLSGLHITQHSAKLYHFQPAIVSLTHERTLLKQHNLLIIKYLHFWHGFTYF